MKNKSYLFMMMTAMLCFACEKESDWNGVDMQVPSEVMINVVSEPIGEEMFDEFGNEIVGSTRAYLSASSSSFSFTSENNDSISYYYAHNDGTVYKSDFAHYLKVETERNKFSGTWWIAYPKDPVPVVSDRIYAYYYTTANCGAKATDVTNVTMSIPAEQRTYTGKQNVAVVDANGDTINNQNSQASYRLNLQNAMPRVANPLAVTTSIINHTKGVVSSMTIRNLASIYEARIYSSSATTGVGEKIQTVEMYSEDGTPLAGEFTINLTSSTSGITNLQGPDCVKVDAAGSNLTVAQGQANYVFVDMVVAPGTYPATVVVTTDQHQYFIEYASKEYKAGVRKSCYVNLASAVCRPLPTVPNWQVTTTIENCFFSRITGNEVVPGDNFFATLVPNLNYEILPENVTVTMGGVDVTAAVYDPYINKVSIYETTGDINITATATLIPMPVTYFVSDELNYCSYFDPIDRQIDENDSFYTVIMPFEGYYIEPQNVHITMGGVDITEQCFDYDVYEINIEQVTGDIRIVIGATKFDADETEGEEEEIEE